MMKRDFFRLKFTEEHSLPACKGLQTLLLEGEPWPKAASGATLGTRVSLSLSGTSKPYSSNSLGLFTSQVIFQCFILNHMPHLAQQLTPDEEGLCFRGAVVLSSSFDNFLKSFQANCRPEIGSNTLRLDVFVPGLNGSSLGEELHLDQFFFFWF